MARGGYNGGSTIIGAGRSWSFDPDFDFRPKDASSPQQRRTVKTKKVAPKPEIVVCGKPIAKQILERAKAADAVGLDRDTMLTGIGQPLPAKLVARAAHLKQLVSDGILLQTGAVNITHPLVAAWIQATPEKARTAKPNKRKKKKQHDQ